ncbi:MAG: DNA-binding response regulator [Betaproteobacteria bacterium]|nr:MAG: DNA-binding response regulator [Betaproteobacteria bacterium]
MTIRAIIADDEPYLARFLADELKKVWPELEIIATLGNGTDAAKLIESLEPDVAFLDIQMPGLTGLEVAQGVEGKTLCVFVTAYDEFAVKAFDEGAVDYLLKPVNTERLRRAVERVKQRVTSGADSATLPASVAGTLQQLLAGTTVRPASFLRYVRAHERNAQGEHVLQIDVHDVLYFDAADKYTCVVLASGEKLLRTSVSELEGQLDPSLFQRIHRSTMVNLRFVHSTRRDESGRMFVRMKDHKRELPVSRAYHEAFARM